MRWLLASLFLLLPAAAVAQAVPKSVTAYLDAEGAKGFSGAVLVARDGEVVERAYGLADREWDVATTLDTKFRIGSLTKQFTAAGILILADRGKLSLDDHVCKFVPDCPSSWAPVRIRQLLDHSSGIPDFVRLPEMRERFTLPATLSGQIAMMKREPLDFAPGSDARYGNSGLLIAAYIIEKLSGLSYDAFIAREIYAPLGMRDSGYAWDAPILRHRARGYTRRDGAYANAEFIHMSIPVGAGSQYSTVRDLYRWDRALYGNELLGEAGRRAMFTANAGGYGLGFEVATENGRRVIEHNGDINGFGAFIARYPDQDAAIIILTNTEGTKVRAMKDAIAELLFARP